MGRSSFNAKSGTDEGDKRAVAALVQILVDSGLQPSRIEAALRNTSTANDPREFADVCASARIGGSARRPRAA